MSLTEDFADDVWLGGPIFAPLALYAALRNWQSTPHTPTIQWTMERLLLSVKIGEPLTLRFVHAVNRSALLQNALAQSTLHIAVGNVGRRADGRLMMGSSEENTLAQWLDKVGGEGGKAVCLQLDSIDTALATAVHLRAHKTSLLERIPMLWVGADVIPLTDRARSQVSHEQFIPMAVEYLADVPLSLGWSYDDTAHKMLIDGRVRESDRAEIKASYWRAVRLMNWIVAPLVKACPNRELTFAIEACLAALLIDQLTWLVQQNLKLYSITVWHLSDCAISERYVDALLQLKNALPNGKMLYDGPEEVREKLSAK